jgi:hypothetical protein
MNKKTDLDHTLDELEREVWEEIYAEEYEEENTISSTEMDMPTSKDTIH